MVDSLQSQLSLRAVEEFLSVSTTFESVKIKIDDSDADYEGEQEDQDQSKSEEYGHVDQY